MTLLRHIIFRVAAVIAALALLASCHEEQPQPETPSQALTVDAYASQRTKGYVEGTTLFDTPYDKLHEAAGVTRAPRSIRLTAWLQPQSGAEQEYFRDEAYARQDDGLWHHDPALYWPMGGHLDFLGYSSTIPFEEVTWHGGKSTDAMSISVDRRFTQDDILYSFIRNQVAGNTDGHVPMVFQHAQAWLQFRIHSTVNDYVTLQDLTLTDVYTDGTLVVEHPFAMAEASWNFRLSRRTDTQVDDNWNVIGTKMTTDIACLDMLLPEQLCRDMVIKYSFGTSPLVFDHRFHFEDGSSWLMGKKYIYDITISPTEIRLAPSVEDWNTVTIDKSENHIYGTGPQTDLVGRDFHFSPSATYYWRPDDEHEYGRVTYQYGTWGDAVHFSYEDYDVTLTLTPGGTYEWSFRRDSRHEPLTLRIREAGTFTFTDDGEGTLEYSLDGETWAAAPAGGLPLDSGNLLRLRRTQTGAAENRLMTLSFSGAHDVFGNIASIVTGGDLDAVPATLNANALIATFKNDIRLVSAADLIIPYQNISERACRDMFYGCTGLTAAPALTATTVNAYGYYAMFRDCISLTDVPDIVATSVAAYGFQNMFYNCVSLTAAPALSVTALSTSVCKEMFYGCSNLVSAPAVRPLSLSSDSCRDMFTNCVALTDVSAFDLTAVSDFPNNSLYNAFYGCAALTAAPTLHPTTLGNNCMYSAFNRCTALTDVSAIDLSGVSTIPDGAMNSMFKGCTSLSSVPSVRPSSIGKNAMYGMFQVCTSLTDLSGIDLSALTTLKDGAMANMFSGCTALVDASTLNLTAVSSLPASAMNSMFYGCTSLRQTPSMRPVIINQNACKSMFLGCVALTDISSIDFSALEQVQAQAMMSMFEDCKKLVTGPSVLPATTLGSECYRQFYKNCENLTTPTALPASTLAESCYRAMFENCKKLTSGPTLGAPTLKPYCYQYMFSGCAALVNAPELPALTLVQNCYNTMFSGCASLRRIKMMATDVSASAALDNWVKGVATTGEFVKNAAASWTKTGISGVPAGWTITTVSI